MTNRNIIYSEHQDVFFEDILRNKVALKMKEATEQASNYSVTNSEFRSWQNSLIHQHL